MLTGGAFQRVRPLERIWPGNLHLPPVVRLRSDDRNPPIPGAIRKRMLDNRRNLNTHSWFTARVMHLHRNCHTPENITTPPAPANHAPPCEDSAAESPKAEYDRGLWRYRLLSSLRSASAETPIGGVPFRPFALSLPNSNCRSGNCSSRQGCIPPRVSSTPGASEIGIGSISPNGYLRSGASP
jgi:hypothetical protein